MPCPTNSLTMEKPLLTTCFSTVPLISNNRLPGLAWAIANSRDSSVTRSNLVIHAGAQHEGILRSRGRHKIAFEGRTRSGVADHLLRNNFQILSGDAFG